MPITKFSQLDLTKTYTYQDYLTWQFKERVELFLGRVFKMSPAPSINHQKILRRVSYYLEKYFWNSKCELLLSPVDVHLPIPKKNRKGDTVVQPDIIVVCDISKLKEQYCDGAPDIVIEILSPGNSKKEMKEKFELYEMSGVPEYWIVDPLNENILRYNFNESKNYIGSKPFVEGEIMESLVIDRLTIPVGEIFKI